MIVSATELNEMKKLQYILRGETPPPELSAPMNSGTGAEMEMPLSTIPGKQEISQMTNLLKIMEGETSSMINESHTNPKVREALTTVKTPRGIQIGSWELVTMIHEGVNAKDETYYSIMNADNNQRINEEIFDHTAAMTVVRLLNYGANVNDANIHKVIKLDEEYQRLRLKAMQEKYNWHKVKNTDNEWRQDLFEAKFDVVKMNALLIKEKIKNLSLTLI